MDTQTTELFTARIGPSGTAGMVGIYNLLFMSKFFILSFPNYNLCIITTLEKTVFLTFSSRHQLQIGSWLGMGLCVSLSFSALRFCLARICTGLACVCCHGLSEFMCISSTVSGRRCFLGITHHFFLLQSLYLLFLLSIL